MLAIPRLLAVGIASMCISAAFPHFPATVRSLYGMNTEQGLVMHGDFLTAEQAAKRAKVSRPTVSRALKAGDLLGKRDNFGKWAILSADVDAWAEKRGHVQLSVTNTEHIESPERLEQLRTDLAHTREALARAEARSETLAETVSDLRQERDRLLTLLETRPAVPVSLWGRLFGRG